jgi:hypothetical protein
MQNEKAFVTEDPEATEVLKLKMMLGKSQGMGNPASSSEGF